MVFTIRLLTDAVFDVLIIDAVLLVYAFFSLFEAGALIYILLLEIFLRCSAVLVHLVLFLHVLLECYQFILLKV